MGGASNDQMAAKIKALGTPKKNKDGKIVFDYIIQFAEVVGKESRIRLVDMLEDNKDTRRVLLKENKHDEYDKMVENLVKMED